MCMCTLYIKSLPNGPYRKGKSNASNISCMEDPCFGAVAEAYPCGTEGAPIGGVIAELIFKAHWILKRRK